MNYSWDANKLKNPAKFLLEVSLFFNRWSLRLKYRNTYKDLEKKISIVENATKHTIKYELKEHEYFWNLSGFLLLASLDIKINAEQLAFSKGFGKKEFYIKNLCLIIFEILDDVKGLLGNKFYKTSNSLNISQTLIDEFHAAKKPLSKFRHEHEKSLKIIRNLVSAHRDHNFILQMETFRGLDYTGFMVLVSEFDSIINNLTVPLQKIMLEVTGALVTVK
jgi:hypothetical protein